MAANSTRGLTRVCTVGTHVFSQRDHSQDDGKNSCDVAIGNVLEMSLRLAIHSIQDSPWLLKKNAGRLRNSTAIRSSW